MSLTKEKRETYGKIINCIDHSQLKPYASQDEIRREVDYAAMSKVYAVCLQPIWAHFAREYITVKKYDLKLAVVLDFPHGSLSTDDRLHLLRKYSAVADELDMPVQVGLVRSGRMDLVEDDLNRLAREARDTGRVLKGIMETAHQTDHEVKALSELGVRSGLSFLKTSTGFADPAEAHRLGNLMGADPSSVNIMADVSERLGRRIGIKASGGIKTLEQAFRLLEAAKRNPDPKEFRIGTSSTEGMVNELRELERKER